MTPFIKMFVSIWHQHQERQIKPHDQHQFTPNNISTSARERLWESSKWSSKRKCFDLLSISPNQFFKETYGDRSGEFICRYGAERVKGLARRFFAKEWLRPIHSLDFPFTQGNNLDNCELAMYRYIPYPWMCWPECVSKYFFKARWERCDR